MNIADSVTLLGNLGAIEEVDLVVVTKHFVQGCRSKKEFSEFTSKEILENYLHKYLTSLMGLIRLCSEYDEGTTLYDTIIKAKGEVRGNGTTNSFSAIFDELQKEINRVATSIDNADILVFVLKMMDDFSMFWEDEKIRKILTEVIEKLPEENAEMLLDCEKICQQPCFDSFLCRLLMRCEDGDLRNKAYGILISRRYICVDHFYILEMERLCREQSWEVLRECFHRINEGYMLTFSCFEKLTQHFHSRETEEIIRRIVELNLQPIPMYFVEEFKKYATTTTSGVVGIGKLLIEKKYLQITAIGCISQLIKDTDTSNLKNIVNLFNTALKVANSIPEDIINELERKTDLNGEITPLLSNLRTIFDGENAVDILANPRVDLGARKQSLDKIRKEDKYHNNRTIKLLETLIKYDEDLRYECFQVLDSILPSDYSKQNCSLDFQTVISSMSMNIADLQELTRSLVSKDRTVDLSGAVNFFTTSNNSLSLTDALPLFVELVHSKKEMGQTIIANNLSFLLKEACFISDSESRDKVCEVVMGIWSLSKGTLELPNNILNVYTDSFSVEQIDDKLLCQLKQCVMDGYPVSEKFIAFAIGALEQKQCKNYYSEITEILHLIHLEHGLGKKANGMFQLLFKNVQMFGDSSIVDKFVDVISGKTVPTPMQNEFEVIVSHNIEHSQMQYNLLKFVNVIFKDYKLSNQILKKITQILLTSEDTDERVLVAEILKQQIVFLKKHFEVPAFVVARLKQVALQSKENNCWKLRSGAFQALENIIEEDELAEDFLRSYYQNLKTDAVKTDILTNESVNLLDEYFDAPEITNLTKFRLLQIISYILSNKLKVNMNKIFSKFKENTSEWSETLSRNMLIASTFQCSENIADKKSLAQRLWEDLSNLKQYLDDFFQSPNLFIQPSNQSTPPINPAYLFEDILQAITRKQKQIHLDISTTQDILKMLCCSERALSIVFSQSNRFHFDLKEKWMEKSLVNYGIDFKNEEKVAICRYFKYGIMVLETVFMKMNKSVTIRELLRFFKMLEKCLPSLEDQKYFLVNETASQRSIDNWIHQLEKVSIKIMLKNHLSVPANFGSVSIDQRISNQYETASESQRIGLGVDNAITHEENQQLKNLCEIFFKLKEIGWHIESIEMLIKLATNQNVQNELLHALNVIATFKLREYETNEDGDNLLNLFQNTEPSEWVMRVNKFMVSRIFPGTYTKPVDALAREICKLNANKLGELALLSAERLITEHENIVDAYKHKSKLLNLIKIDKICNWSKDTIRLWAQTFKDLRADEKKESVSIYEKIAVATRAVEVVTSPLLSLRDIQLLSLLFMFITEKGKGRLMQINTGEGKTTVIAMFAAIKALEGHTVDVITSSSELAKPQSKQQGPFFKCFGLTVSHNEEARNADCYKADIVYGSANTFMGDVLRDEYHKLSDRHGRKFDTVVVDEVDSMLIDGKDHIVMLSAPMPSLNHLEPVLAVIWVQLHKAANTIIEEKGVTYYLKPMLKADKNEEKTVEYKKIPLNCTKQKYLKTSTETHLKKLLGVLQEGEDPIPEKFRKLTIPKHLKPLVTEVHLSNWIDSAIRAIYRCENGKDYVIKNNRIVPVDAVNTGTLQLNMLWSNGLHQFLQFKHGESVTPESLTTNFISNVTFFKRYKCNLYGLTGTLGSTAARNLLDETYVVDSIIIPPFQKKQYQELNTIFVHSMEDWLQNIVQSSLIHLGNGRAVLIITKYIQDADKILKMFKSFKYDTKKVKMYRTADDSDVINRVLEAGELIIATNIAGRGTDIIPSEEVENNGGLHVCITFLPVNERVEEQNRGRTSRTGKRGTGQFILLEDDEEKDISTLKESRNKEEKISLKKAKEDIARIIVKDNIFQKFCALLNNLFDPAQSDVNSIKRKAVEERFAIWLKMNEVNLMSEKQKDMVEEFERFETEIRSDAVTDTLPQNPCYYIIAGNAFLENEKYNEAIKEYSKAIKMDEDFVADAYYYRAFAYIAKYGSNVKKNRDKMEKPITDLKKARDIIENTLEGMIFLLSFASKGEMFVEQIRRKMKLLSVQKNCILSAVGCDVNNLMAELRMKKEGMSHEEKAIVDEKIEECEKNKEKYNKGIIQNMVKAGININVKFQDNKTLLPEENMAAYDVEIAENCYNGQTGYFQVTDKKPLFRSLILLVFGIAKVVAGTCLIAFTEGFAAGMGCTITTTGFSELIAGVKDGIFSKNKIQNWESCGLSKFAILAVFFEFYGYKVIEDTVQSFFQKENVFEETKDVPQGNVSTKGTILGEKVREKIQEEMDDVLDEIANANISAFYLSDMQDQIFSIIKVPFQQILARNEKILKLLRHNNANITDTGEELISQINKKFFKKTWTYLFKKTWNKFKFWNGTKIDKNIPVADIKKAIDKMCEALPEEFEKALNQIISQLSISEHENRPQIIQNLDYISTSSCEKKGDLDLKKDNVPQEQVELVNIAQEMADIISYKLSESMADHIHQELISPVFFPATQTENVDKLTKKLEDCWKKEYPSRNHEGKNSNESYVESSVVENVANVETLTENAKVGLMGTLHLDPISIATNHKIVVSDQEGKVTRIIDETKYIRGNHIHVQYHKSGNFEYWTCPGKKERHKLQNIIAEQINVKPFELQKRLVETLEKSSRRVSKRINDNEISNFCWKNVLTDWQD